MQAKNWRFSMITTKMNLMNFPIRISSFNKSWLVAFSHGNGIGYTCCHDQLMTSIQSFAWHKLITFQYSPAAYQIVTEWLKFLMKFKTLHSEYQLIEHICMYMCCVCMYVCMYMLVCVYILTHTFISFKAYVWYIYTRTNII